MRSFIDESMRREKLLGTLVLLPALLASTAFADSHNHNDLLATCRGVVQNIDRFNDVDVIYDCWDFYWHAGDPADTVEPYDRIIQLGERLTVIDVEQDTVYGDISWLYWSRWKQTKDDPSSYPQENKYIARMENLIDRGMAAPHNMANFSFLSDTGFTLYLMKKDVPQVVPQMLKLWKRGLGIANLREPEEKKGAVNISKQLGYHYYHDENNKVKALGYFRYALKLQPDNSGAQKMAEKISRELAEGKIRSPKAGVGIL